MNSKVLKFVGRGTDGSADSCDSTERKGTHRMCGKVAPALDGNLGAWSLPLKITEGEDACV